MTNLTTELENLSKAISEFKQAFKLAFKSEIAALEKVVIFITRMINKL